MTSLAKNTAAEYRARAQEARTKAATESDEAARKALLSDADLWERMAAFEDRQLRAVKD